LYNTTNVKGVFERWTHFKSDKLFVIEGGVHLQNLFDKGFGLMGYHMAEGKVLSDCY